MAAVLVTRKGRKAGWSAAAALEPLPLLDREDRLEPGVDDADVGIERRIGRVALITIWGAKVGCTEQDEW